MLLFHNILSAVTAPEEETHSISIMGYMGGSNKCNLEQHERNSGTNYSSHNQLRRRRRVIFYDLREFNYITTFICWDNSGAEAE